MRAGGIPDGYSLSSDKAEVFHLMGRRTGLLVTWQLWDSRAFATSCGSPGSRGGFFAVEAVVMLHLLRVGPELLSEVLLKFSL